MGAEGDDNSEPCGSKYVSNEAISSLVTGESGTFEFKDISPGVYFLRVETKSTDGIKWYYPNDGYVPVMVDPASDMPSLNLILGSAVCGELAYKNLAAEKPATD